MALSQESIDYLLGMVREQAHHMKKTHVMGGDRVKLVTCFRELSQESEGRRKSSAAVIPFSRRFKHMKNYKGFFSSIA